GSSCVFSGPPAPAIYTLSLHDALPIFRRGAGGGDRLRQPRGGGGRGARGGGASRPAHGGQRPPRGGGGEGAAQGGREPRRGARQGGVARGRSGGDRRCH